MSQALLQPTTSKRTRPRTQTTVYCRFASINSLNAFKQYQRSPNKPQNQRPTEESSRLSPSEESIISEIEQLELTQIPRVKKTYHCRKCFKELLEDEELDGICGECLNLDKLVDSGNFQKFVAYLIEFKMGIRQSYRQENKLRRIESIQSIQSFTLDRHDSQMRANIHPFRHPAAEVLNSVQNTINLSKRSDLGEWTTSNGYFCNGCSVEPIVGRRFHCLSCEDYDLCEKCYFYLGHKHDMKSFKEQPQDIAHRARLGAIKRSESLQNTLPFLSSSIRDFEQASKLFRTTTFKHI